jgi:hypothetical protein
MRRVSIATLPLVLALAGCDKPADKSPPAAAAATTTAAEPAAGSDAKPHRRKHEDRREPVIADAPPLQLTVAVDGSTTTWHQDAFDKVAKYTRGTDGEARDVWSLRELAHALVGPTARVVSVTGEDGTKPIDRAAWDDAARTPVLHTTRRGTLKFRWTDADGKWGDSEIKDVTKIDLAR